MTVRLTNATVRKFGQFYATAHGIMFVGESVDAVFDAIDKYEEHANRPAASYIVYDMEEYPITTFDNVGHVQLATKVCN